MIERMKHSKSAYQTHNDNINNVSCVLWSEIM